MFIVRFLLISVLFLSSSLWASVGKVSLLKGEANVDRNSAKVALQNGSMLEEKDIIKTSKDAQIQLIFEDKTVVTLGSESEFKIEEYLNGATSPKVKFKFNQGSFKTITGKIGKAAPENVTLETKTATIGIRGTWIRGKIDADSDTIGCLRGKIFVRSLRGGRVIEVIEGRKTFVGLDKDPTDPTLIGEGDFDDRDFRENARNKEKDAGDYDSFGYWDNNGYQRVDSDINERPLFGGFIDPNSQVTPTSYIATLIAQGTATYIYEGTVSGTTTITPMGPMPVSVPGAIINNANNFILIAADFGSSTINGTIKFDSTQPQAWGNNNNITGTLTTSGFTGTIAAMMGASGSITGSFYGPNAESAKGTFVFKENYEADIATGTFTAPKVP